MDELDELMPRRRMDYTRFAIQMLDLLSVVILLVAISFNDTTIQLAVMAVAALIAWIATWLSIRYRSKAKNPIGALISLIISLIVAVVISIIFFYTYASSGGITGLI